MDERTKRELIAAAVEATRAAADARAHADELSAVRRDAIRRAMDAGVPRQELADAVGVNRVTLYEIIGRK